MHPCLMRSPRYGGNFPTSGDVRELARFCDAHVMGLSACGGWSCLCGMISGYVFGGPDLLERYAACSAFPF